MLHTILQKLYVATILAFIVLTPSFIYAFEFSEYEVITEDTIWTKTESPYVFTNNTRVQFASSTILTIEPGVVVKFGDSTNLDILGDFYAVGTQEEPIVFTSLKDDSIAGDTNGDGGASFPTRRDNWLMYIGDYRSSHETTATASFVELRYSGRGVVVENSQSKISDVLITTSTYGMYFYLGDVDLKNVTIDTTYSSGVSLDTVSAKVDTVFASNLLGDALSLYWATVDMKDIFVSNVRGNSIEIFRSIVSLDGLVAQDMLLSRLNIIDIFDSEVDISNASISDVGDGAAIAAYNANVTISDSVLRDGLSHGINTYAWVAGASMDLSNVTVEGFLDYGVSYNEVAMTIKNSRIENNFIGIESYFDAPSDVLTIENSSVANNVLYGLWDYGSLETIQAGGNWWGDSTGPYHATDNPDGLGDVIKGDIDISNWLTVPPGEPPVSEIDPLLLEYMPVLYMHPDEDYFPMNVEAFVEGSAIWDDRGILTDKELVSAGVGNDASLDYIATTTDTSNWYIQFSGTDAKELDLDRARTRYNQLLTDGDATSTVYVHKMEDSYTDEQGVQHEFIVLQYWYFYAMNNWKEQGGFNNHEGDWESVFVYLDKNTEEPKYVAYSSHLNDGDSNDDSTQYTSVRRDWDSNDISFDNGRVITFVAAGSHANYPNLGNQGVHNVPFFLQITYEDMVSSFGEHNIGNVNILPDAASSWLSYEGKWGADGGSVTGGDNGPQGPLYIDVTGEVRFDEPVHWAGLDQVNSLVVTHPTTTFSFASSTVGMNFSAILSAGTELSVSVHDELISFGENISSINLLPKFWDFRTSLENESFDVSVSLEYSQEQLALRGVDEEFMQVYLYNEVENVWQPVPSSVDTSLESISFDTTHFSRYALGSPSLSPLDEGIIVKSHLGAYDQSADTRKVLMSIHNTGTSTLAGTIRMVVRNLTEESVELINANGVTAGGDQYVDVSVAPLELKQKVQIPALHFKLPTKINASIEANEEAQNENAEFKQFGFSFQNYIVN